MRIHLADRLSLALLMAAGVFACCPAEAAAHLVTTGMGPVYDGIGHLLLTPEDLVPVLALALYAGQRGAVAGRRAMFLLPIAWFVGGLGGLMANGLPSYPLPAASFLLLGALVAADLRVAGFAVPALAVGIGLVHGFLNGVALEDGPGALGLLGIMTILFVLVALAAAFVVSLRRDWTRIAVRVIGSWVFASGLLMIGWYLKVNG